jgi:hypothetical protein
VGEGGLAADGVRTAAPAANRQRRVRVGVAARGSRGMGWRVWAAHGPVGGRKELPGPERTVSTWI